MNYSAETATTTRLRSLQSSATSLPMSSSSMINTCTINSSYNNTTTTILNSVNTAKNIFNNINNYRIISTSTAFQKANHNHNNSNNHHPKTKPTTTAKQLSNTSSSSINEQTAALMMLSLSGKTGIRDRATAIGGEIEPLLPSSVSTSATMSPMHETYNANDKIIQIGLHNQNNNNNSNNNYNNNSNNNNRNENSIEKNISNSDIIGITMVDCTDNSSQHSHHISNGNFNPNQNDGDSNEESSSLLMTPENMIIRTQQTPITWKNVIILNFLSFLFVSLMMIVNLLVISIIHERVPMDQPHLPDIAFDILPDHRHFLDIAEYVIVIQTFCISVLLFFHKYRSTILRRICLIMGIIYFFRAICLISTQLPLASKNYYCSPQLKNSSAYENITAIEFIDIIFSRVFYMSLGMGLSINGHHTFCGDYIFSGHTVILVLTYLIQQEYLLPTRRRTLAWKCVNLIQITMTVTSVICILIARGHYFIDIIIAYFATTRIFWIYHTLCHSTQSQSKSNAKYLKRVWWWPLFVYLENIQIINSIPTSMMVNNHYHTSHHHHHHTKSDEHHRYNDTNQVQRVFEWPLPWPKSFARRSKHHRSHQFTA